MDDSIQRRIVKIQLPTPNDDASIFSGYIIGDGLIITCYHGFMPKNGNFEYYDTSAPIKVSAQGEENEWTVDLKKQQTLQGLIDKKIILFASKKYDIVLLNAPKTNAEFCALMLSILNDTSDWLGGGFPEFSQEENETKGFDALDGEASYAAANGKLLKLKPRQKPYQLEHWKRVSGSPIFINDKLAGIVRWVSSVVENQLEATYLKRLWEDSDEKESQFKTILEARFKAPPSSFCEDETVQLIEDNYDLREVIKTYLGYKGNEIKSEALVSQLLQKDKLETMAFCLENKGIKAIDQLVMTLLRHHFTHLSTTKNEEHGYIEVAYVDDVAAEYAMAGEDEKAPQLIIDEEGEAAVNAKHFIKASFPPNSGVNNTALADTTIELENTIADISKLHARLGCDHRIYQRGIGNFDDTELKGFAKKVLEKSPRSYYMKLKIEERHLPTIREITKKIPSIKILKTPEDRSSADDEWDIFENLHHFIKD